MELQELKEIWTQYDRKLDKSVKLNVELLKEIKLGKARSQLRRSAFVFALELFVNLAAVVRHR